MRGLEEFFSRMLPWYKPSLVQRPAMGFRDGSVPRQTYKHDRGRGFDPSVK